MMRNKKDEQEDEGMGATLPDATEGAAPGGSLADPGDKSRERGQRMTQIEGAHQPDPEHIASSRGGR